VSGAKSDSGDAHALADMVRTDSHQLRPAAGDSPEAEGIKVLARTHKTMIWERTHEAQRLRHQLREYFPAALEAGRAARLTRAQVSAALKPPGAGTSRAGDRDAGRAAQRGVCQPEALTVAYAVTVRALVAVIGTLNEQASALEQQMRDDFGRHPDAEIILSHIKPVLVQAAWAAIRVRAGSRPGTAAWSAASAATGPQDRAALHRSRRGLLHPPGLTRPAARLPGTPAPEAPPRLHDHDQRQPSAG
jgi:hypothetical protein